MTRARLAAELASSLGPEVAAALIAAEVAVAVAAAIAIVLMIVVFLVVIAVFEAIKVAWEDDVFVPQTVMTVIESLAAAESLNLVGEGLWGPLNFVGHGGHYHVRYSWRCV
jgi:tellurite resistance protein TehA-like permease